MQKLLAVLLFFVPHPFNKYLRILAGQKVSKKSKIHLFSYLHAQHVEIGDHCYIGPLTFIKTTKVRFGKHVHIAPLVLISSAMLEGAHVNFGDFVRIFPFCWLEPGEGITLGEQTGLGGYSMIFTHGVWANHLLGGPVSYGPVVVGRHVWLPVRVLLLPNVVIGDFSIVGASSVVTKSLPPHSLAVGAPAKIIKEGVFQPLGAEEFNKRAAAIMDAWPSYCRRIGKDAGRINAANVHFIAPNSPSPAASPLITIDVVNAIAKGTGGKDMDRFVFFLRRYGIRVSPTWA